MIALSSPESVIPESLDNIRLGASRPARQEESPVLLGDEKGSPPVNRTSATPFPPLSFSFECGGQVRGGHRPSLTEMV